MQKKFTDNENGQKVQDLVWPLDEEMKLSATYFLIDKKWILQNYKTGLESNLHYS